MEKDTQLIVSEKDIKLLVMQLKKKEIGFFDIPEELRIHSDIVRAERKLGIRKSHKRGYDVLRNTFFVEERVVTEDSLDERISTCFANFASYYDFLEGDIYENACYYQYRFSQAEIDTYNIDLNRINNIALIDFTVKDCSVELLEKDLQQYEKQEKEKDLRKRWIARFNSCNTYEDFLSVLSDFNKSNFLEEDLLFFLCSFIFADKNKSFDIIMKYISERGWSYGYRAVRIAKTLCSIYDPQKVLAAYNFKSDSDKKWVQEYINQLKNGKIDFKYSSYFDESTHYFCHQITGYEETYFVRIEKREVVNVYRYFETIQELAQYLDNDLSGCDLSGAILPNIDFSVYKTDEHTKWPIQNIKDLTCSLYKGYDRRTDCFVVKHSWLNSNGKTVKEYENIFQYFFDFVLYLENDLSNADLLFCDGLKNLDDFSKFNLTNAKLRSEILDRIGTSYPLSTINIADAEDFPVITRNEEETALTLTLERERCDTEDGYRNLKVSYITDLHLLHRLKNASCKSQNDIIYTVQAIIDDILDECGNIILIGGDTSSDFNLFCLFIHLLRKSIDEEELLIPVIFMLGNHELWEFPNCSFEEIVQKYEAVITKHKMYLLQNEMLYKDDYSRIHKITTDELLTESKETLRTRLRSARLILFGGLAFSGHNKEFNANNGIYRDTINRKQEVAESKTFECLYNIVCETLFDKSVIVFTHTPQKDWCSHDNPQSGFIYVNGHTHRNYFHDDGEYRIYADNQVGYKCGKPHLKYFFVENDYDWFSGYGDGIYEITKEDYINFHRGKNIQMSFARDVNILYMLKKKGYYCFIHQSKMKKLSILNGGAMKKLYEKNIKYYYKRMDAVIAHIKNPLDKYISIQKQLADEIKSIGGDGKIHGAIIDIDFNNHIYVNPYDLSITGYWAFDIIYKKVFPSIPKLLEANCPLLYANYTKLLSGKTDTLPMVGENGQHELDTRPHIYLDTDIYKASREIKKMQKLYNNILTTWYEPTQKKIE